MDCVQLIERLKSYDPSADEERLINAYTFSKRVHDTQIRASGDPYFSHPLEVANILLDFRLDLDSIITALLHDTVEDTAATLDEIRQNFGPAIATLVDGVTKLSKIELQSEHTRQAENFRKLVLAMSSDIRVLLVKLADRLHNMRTLGCIEDLEKRRRIARETLDIYVPLAERIGMNHLKDELEDLTFIHLNPEARDSIRSRLRFLHDSGEELVENIMSELRLVFQEVKLPVQISGREKSTYSIWKKMQTKNVALEQLADIMAFRILVDTVGDCYHALGILHGTYMVVPGRFKDYISTPKANNYQSLHTTLIGPHNHKIEVQIRTHAMHEVSQLGVAAHWQYKQGAKHEGKQYAWIRGLLDILEQASNPEEFLEHTKLEMFADQVFCFTPKGDLIPLPKGATPIDFAYAVHSAVGDHTVGVKINGRQMPLRTKLHNGDQVDVITSKNQTPSPAWEKMAVTGKARARIRRFLRTQRRQQFFDLGKSIFFKAVPKEQKESIDKILENALKHYKIPLAEDFFAAVGEGIVSLRDTISSLLPVKGGLEKAPFRGLEEAVDAMTPLKRVKKPFKKGKHDKPPLYLKGLIAGMAVHFAKCCHPLPGDHIQGVVVTGKGVSVHTSDCPTLHRFAAPERMLDIDWEDAAEGAQKYVGRLHVLFTNKAGSLASVTTAISKQGGNFINMRVINRSIDFWEIYVDIEVKDKDQLLAIVAVLRTLSIVNLAERTR